MSKRVKIADDCWSDDDSEDEEDHPPQDEPLHEDIMDIMFNREPGRERSTISKAPELDAIPRNTSPPTLPLEPIPLPHWAPAVAIPQDLPASVSSHPRYETSSIPVTGGDEQAPLRLSERSAPPESSEDVTSFLYACLLTESDQATHTQHRTPDHDGDDRGPGELEHPNPPENWLLDDEGDFFDAEEDPSSEDEEVNSSPSDPLFLGANCSLGTCLTVLLTFIMSHSLSKHCVGDLLSMLKLLLPKGNIMLTSVRKFFDHFNQFQSSTKKHYYCQFCTEALRSVSDVCARCGPGKGTSFFIQMSVREQLQHLFQRPGFIENLNYPSTRVKDNEDSFEDIYDGAIYKETKIFLGNGKWITFMWSTDGLCLFRSSNFEIWPFYLAINELPPHLRFKRENLILCGLWFGKGSFDPNLYLKPIYEELQELKTGVYFNLPNNPEPILYQAYLLCGTCDTPAKSKFLNHNTFNGRWGCPKCLSRGEKSAETGNVWVYRFEEDLVPRTDENYRQHLAVVRETNDMHMGIKGPSFIQLMLLTSMIRSTSIDAMHAVFLGVMKYMLHLLFDEKKKNEPFSLFHSASVVNEYLTNVKPPHFLQRVPQALSKLAYWKASEYESFLFYYSLPIFKKVMPQTLFNHFKLFYHGIVLLYQKSVSAADIQLSQSLLDQFCRKFPEFYDLRFMTFNLHLLRHLPSVVLELGPLWTSTCFAFEDMNGCLKQMVHGSQQTAMQVKSTFELVSRIRLIFENLPDSSFKNLCKNMHASYSRLKLTICISPNIYVVGLLCKSLENLNDLSRNAISNVEGNILYFKRLKKENILFVASCDTKTKKDSSVVLYSHYNAQEIGLIQSFIKVSQCLCTNDCQCQSQYFAVIQNYNCFTQFDTLEPVSEIEFVVRAESTNIAHIVNVKDLESVCVTVEVEDKLFVAPILNHPNCQ